MTLISLKNQGKISKIFACDILQEKSGMMPSGVDGFFTDWQEMVDTEKPNIVAVITPPGSHEEISIKLLNQGIDLLVEKPLATTFTGATSILTTSQTNGRILLVGYLLRFHSAINTALEQISSGLIGALERIEFTRITTREPSNYTDVFQALAVHGIDTACYCFGELEPERIHLSQVKHSALGKATSAEILLEFPGQREANITTAWLGKEEKRVIRFYGGEGILQVDMNNHNQILHELNEEVFYLKTQTSQLPLESEWNHMISMFEGNATPRKRQFPSQGAILRSIRLIDQVTEYARFEYDKSMVR